MTNQATNADSGFRKHRVEFVREDTPGETPVDPEWELYSDTLDTAFQWDADAQYEEQRGLGDHEVQNHFTGAEDHTASIGYHLQRFFVDDGGDPLDPAGDAILRDDDGDLRNTHTVVDRADYGDSRTYVVARGGYPNIDDVSGDPGSALPIVLSLAYEAKKVRMYKVGQPDGDALSVYSTSGEDTTQTVTIESDGATTSAEVVLDGETESSTTDPFDSIDAIELDEPTAGDVVIEDADGSELARLKGAESYDGALGDLGVPALGDGSHADPISEDYERFLDDEITKGGSQLAAEVRSASFSLENGYEKNPVMGTTEQAIHTGEQSPEFTATVAGNFEYHSALTDHLEGNTFDLEWHFDGGTVTFEGCALTGPGTVGPASGDVISTLDNTFTPKSIDVQAD
ncbi:hypothetical protein [Natrialba asiatica]|uniref:Uncharacterized protein n=1 Tax=Natrialba asiatica (strain ATCC 700177 / DSM 12278 / JCM 9576 / FERM P-10747 / NBRC 102637 / 172P1) TaxID=29540 RepID=M0ATR3_NATA1|nr:hypothetical protein [Natrialba asiatica]ELZ00764.1 hypothetical protein C481_11035 [Natrialba asiatica DSM 12278]